MLMRVSIRVVETSIVARVLLSFILCSIMANPAFPKCGEFDRQEPSVRSSIIARGLVYPWSVAFLPGGDMLITERPGRLRVVRQGALSDQTIQGLPRLVNLFDVVAHPDYSNNRLLYLAYWARTDNAVGLEVLRARFLENRLVDGEIVFRATPKDVLKPLSGGRLLFMPDSTLLVTVGDRGDGLSSGHDPSNHFGTVVRVTESGLVPDGKASFGDSRLPEIYTFGHRNIQGIARDPDTGKIWIAEHGPVGGDELNILRQGGNYGWPIEHFGEVEGTTPIGDGGADSQQGFEHPVVTWTPAVGPSGLAFYRGEKFPEWAGSLFVGSLLGCDILRLRADDDGKLQQEEALIGELGARIRDVRVGPDERVYVLTDEIDGKLLSIAPLQAAPGSQVSAK